VAVHQLAAAAIRDRVGDLPVPAFDHTPAVRAPELAAARVAIVTTAGLRTRGDVTLWPLSDGSFTVLPAPARDLQLAHFSPNFDRSGFAADLNVVYPADRLAEMAARGEIGSVGDHHVSFMGAQTDATFSTILLDTGPAAARVLLDDGVDVALLTPV
jgi:D-proline reductase (dithiol) PrdB